MAGHRLDPLPVARHERDPVADQLHEPVVVEARVAGSKISTVALCMGVDGDSGPGRPGPAFGAARSSVPLRGVSPGVGSRACSTWDSDRGGPGRDPSPVRQVEGSPPCAGPGDPDRPALHHAFASACGGATRPAPRSRPRPSPLRGGDDAAPASASEGADRDPDGTQQIEITVVGDTVTPERRAGRGGRGRAGRAHRRGRPARRDPRALRPRAGARVRRGHRRRSSSTRSTGPAWSRSSRTTSRRRSSSSKPADSSPGGVTLAHGIGGAKDLPISPELAIAGAVAALTVSFTVLAVAWRNPRYDAATSGRRAGVARGRRSTRRGSAAPCGSSASVFRRTPPWRRCFGEDLLTNPFFGMFYVWWWVGMVASPAVRAGLEGDQPGPHDQRRRWPGSPAATPSGASSTTRTGSATGRPALGLYAFVWIELVYP